MAFACSIFFVAAVVVVALWFAPSAGARRAWKDRAIVEISSRATNPTWMDAERARIRAMGTRHPDDSDSWLSPHLIVMRNGDWIVYTNICQKEDRRVRDLFLGRGSDGRWYYSTFHFCKGMIVLRMENQPADLATFAAACYLRPFDGQSDDCLQQTWPPDAR